MITGLKCGSVKLFAHQKEWETDAAIIIQKLKNILGSVAVDVQHVGSTSIPAVSAKPIIDIAVGAASLEDILPYIDLLGQQGFIFRGEDVEGQLLFVMGDFENDTRTHHIHVVKWNGKAWNDYINFRDYLNAHTEQALRYDECKRKLALQFPDNRKSYTEGKQKIIDELLKEAALWRVQL